MACLIRKRGKFYRKVRLDVWAYYTTYKNKLSKRDKLDRTVYYWCRLKVLSRNYYSFKKRRYVYRLWNRTRFKFPKKLKENYIKPRHLRNFYMILKKRTYVKYVKLARKGQVVRGFTSAFLGYLEGRLFIIVYRLNLINNIFMIKNMINMGIFQINLKKKTHINSKMQLGDLLHIEKRWRSIIKNDMIYKISQGIITRNIKNFYYNFEKLYFVLYKPYKFEDIHYPIRIDLYRAIDFIGNLR